MDCQHRCPVGSPCTLEPNGHVLHVCNNPHCPCHSKERYAEEAWRRSAGVTNDGPIIMRYTGEVLNPGVPHPEGG